MTVESAPPPTKTAGQLLEIYERLYASYGPQHWWPGETPLEVIVGAILVQSTAWESAERAIGNLKSAGALSLEGLRTIDERKLASLIRPSGYFNTKARKLKAFVEPLNQRFEGDLELMLAAPLSELRLLLLATHGIGPETADSILLYAAEKPVFVIDAYTRRVFSRLAIAPDEDTYSAWQVLFMDALPSDAALFNEYHALIVRHAKERCGKMPLCESCPLLAMCPMGQASVNTILLTPAVTA